MLYRLHDKLMAKASRQIGSLMAMEREQVHHWAAGVFVGFLTLA